MGQGATRAPNGIFLSYRLAGSKRLGVTGAIFSDATHRSADSSSGRSADAPLLAAIITVFPWFDVRFRAGAHVRGCHAILLATEIAIAAARSLLVRMKKYPCPPVILQTKDPPPGPAVQADAAASDFSRDTNNRDTSMPVDNMQAAMRQLGQPLRR